MGNFAACAISRPVWCLGLDLRLSYRGLSTARCMVARKGFYLVEPTGPVWARRILEEAVEEWCELDSEMN